MRGTVLAIVSSALLAGLLFYPQSAADADVISLSHSPLNPTPDDEVSVTVQLSNASEVNKTYISWCQATPILCYVPKEMKYIGDNTYSYNLGKNVDGQEIKYNITIMYKNGTSSVTETLHFSVHKPSNGGGNNNNTTNNNTNTTGDDGTDPATPNYLPYIAIAVVVVMAVVAALFFMKRKKPGSP